MSKLSFRARALDAAKPLPVYRDRDLPDLNDCVSINRAVPQMPTGMEKEEELEHHLQRAISAQQVFREKKENMVIPVPEAESNITYYDRLYKGELKVPKQLIHIQPLGLDNEQPDYDMDSEDETLLNRLNRKMEIKPLQFETMVDRLEKASANQLVSLPEAKLLLNEDDYLLKSVYDYWVRKRKNCRGPTLTPQIKQEKRDGSTNNDAYVAFRRRTEKMQTRKNRKNDEASYEKMLKLRREFSRTVTILEMIKRREKAKRELLHLTLEVVEKRYQLGDFTGEVLSEVTVPLVEKPVYAAPVPLAGNRHKTELKIKMHKTGLPHAHQVTTKEEHPFDFVRPKKKYTKREKLYPPRRPGRPPSQYTVNKADIKQYDFHSSGEEDYPPPLSPPSEPDEENDPDGVFAFRRKAGCQYFSPCTEQAGGALWEHPELAGMDSLRHRHSLTSLSVPRHCVGLARRRMGRGGRVILDRASSGVDTVLRQLDPDILTTHVPRTGASNLPDSPTFAQITPSGSAASAAASSLAEILSNIQTLRWRCFKPRPAEDQDNEESRTVRESLAGRMTTGLPLNTKNKSSGGITEEQYLNHRQQLAQMQKQQLAQLQQAAVPLSKHSSLLERNNMQTASSNEFMSKTLDSASAHFAASAVISTPPLGHINNENKPQKTSVNGVLHPSGTSRSPHSTSMSHSSTGAPGRLSSSGGGPLLPTHSTSSSVNSPQSLPNHRSHVSAVSPAHHHHSARPSAPSPSALKLATMATTLDRVPKVTPASAVGSLARESHEPERLLNGISETTLAMEVT
ncbi:enhancer of polycomb homolog 2 [Lampris incognitus]|uniref:enhancer of polycomb homolog 2 n=1 Tax=Lampris incognitus TaxID=2546036 RepID=UPI0024B496F6|nr:enhancer of polycomb homolog 2 [Lampris incognitus]